MPRPIPRRIQLNNLIIEQLVSVFPFGAKGRHPQLVNEADTASLSLRPVISPSRSLQRTITHAMFRSTTEVNEKFLGRDLNPLD
jgi:hypothetical protein